MNKQMSKVLSILMIIMLVCSWALSVYADKESDLENERSNVQNQIKQTEEEINRVKSEMSTNMKQIDNLNSQIDGYEDEIYELEAKLEELNSQIETKKAEVEKKEKEYKENEELLKKRLVASYKAKKTQYLDVLLNSGSLSDFLSKYFLLEKLAAHDTDLLKQIQNQKEDLERQKADLEAKQKEVDDENTKLKLRREALEVIVRDKTRLIDNLSEQEKDLQGELEDLRDTDSNIKSQLNALRQAKIPSRIAEAGANYSGVVGGGGLSYPVEHVATSAEFGQSGPYWSLGYHTGLDFRCSDNTPVFASANGKVVEAGYSRAYGNHIILYHPDLGIFTLYAHGTELYVGYGEYVSRGQCIMASGHTGNVTGPHLHFEVRVGSGGFRECVDPWDYLP